MKTPAEHLRTIRRAVEELIYVGYEDALHPHLYLPVLAMAGWRPVRLANGDVGWETMSSYEPIDTERALNSAYEMHWRFQRQTAPLRQEEFLYRRGWFKRERRDSTEDWISLGFGGGSIVSRQRALRTETERTFANWHERRRTP